MLRPISDIYVREGEPKKLWFTDEKLDLYIWLSDGDGILRFEFTYDKPNSEKSFLWRAPNTISHTEIDDGANAGKHPSSPISLGEVPLDKNRVIQLFNENKEVIPRKYFLFIHEKISNS